MTTAAIFHIAQKKDCLERTNALFTQKSSALARGNAPRKGTPHEAGRWKSIIRSHLN